ncbi:MAG: hypothetical protein AB7F89_27725 [Pirellulaceae bacterium]
MKQTHADDPFQLLGVARDAGEAEIRVRYLELVKQFPPEREPDKFRAFRAAYEAVKDPLAIAKRLVELPAEEIPSWDEAIEAQRKNPPRLTPSFILSLGNRAVDEVPARVSGPRQPTAAGPSTDPPAATPPAATPPQSADGTSHE